MKVLLLLVSIISMNLWAQDYMQVDDVNVYASLGKSTDKYSLKKRDEVLQFGQMMLDDPIYRPFLSGINNFIDEYEDEKVDLIAKSIIINELSEMNIGVRWNKDHLFRNSCPVSINAKSNLYKKKVNEFYNHFKELEVILGGRSNAIEYYRQITKRDNFSLSYFNPDQVFKAKVDMAKVGPHKSDILGITTMNYNWNKNCTSAHIDDYLGYWKTTILEWTLLEFNKNVENAVDRIQRNIDLIKKKIKGLKSTLDLNVISANAAANQNDDFQNMKSESMYHSQKSGILSSAIYN